jgi:hypothetical protein
MPKQPRRCGARMRVSAAGLDRAIGYDRVVQYLRRSGGRCRNWPVRGKERCRFHGGYSTGPTTPDGMARTVAAMKLGRWRWLRRMRADGIPIPCGRKRGGRNLPLEEREQLAVEKRRRREARILLQGVRVARRRRRVRERDMAQDCETVKSESCVVY